MRIRRLLGAAGLVLAGALAANLAESQVVGGLVCGPVGIGCPVLRTVAGTAASPAQTSINDTTSGYFFPASGLGGFSAGGNEVARFNASGFMPISVPSASSSSTGITLTAAIMVNGVLNRTGVGASQTDTTDTAANLYTAMGSPPVGSSFTFDYVNNQGSNTVTLGAGNNVTLVGNATLAVSAKRGIRCVVTATTPTFSCFI